MARPQKVGVDYFPFDVNLLKNIKVRKIMRACGNSSIAILICLLCNIYEDDGYYAKWDEDTGFLIADEFGVKTSLVDDVVQKAVQVDFFDKDKFENYNILTSRGIQERYLEITRKRKRVVLIKNYLLVDVFEIQKNINVYINGVNDNINSVNVSHNTQSKVKESKVNKSKLKENKETVTNLSKIIDDYSENEELKNTLNNFIEMRKSLKKPITEYGLDLLLKNLDKLAIEDNKKIAIVEQSIMNSYQGIFELKSNNHHKNKYWKPTDKAIDEPSDEVLKSINELMKSRKK